MLIKESESISAHTSFRTGGPARFYVEVESKDELKEVVQKSVKDGYQYIVLGEGSNVLFSDKGFDGYVIRPKILGLDFHSVGLVASAGENWDKVVGETVERGFSGLENLSYIPGSVGAAPIQNIGAYGTEVGEKISWVEVYDPQSNTFSIISNDDCRFGYRESLFKSPLGKNLIVTRVSFDLDLNGETNIEYKDLANYFSNAKHRPSVAEVRSAVIDIRKNKLPDINKIGTAGSFFKNPVVSQDQYLKLKEKFSDLPAFEMSNGDRKIPLAWVLDKILNLKGYREGNVGLYEKQPLAIVNFGGATTNEIKKFSEKISAMVKDKINLEIEREVNFFGN